MNRIHFYFSKWKFQASKFDDILRVKARTSISLLFQKFRLIAGGSLSPSFLRESKIIAMKLQELRERQGVKGLTLYLKSSSVALQQSLAGYRIDNLTLVGPRISRTGSGLPRIIPRSHRLVMVNRLPGSYLLMRYYLSIFYLYRVLVFPGKVKLETITSPGKYYDENRFGIHLGNYITLILKKIKVSPLIYIQERCRVFPIFRSSPFTSCITYSPFKVKESKKKQGSLWSTHVVSLIDAARHVIASPLRHLFEDILKAFQFRELTDYLKYLKGLKATSDGVLVGRLSKMFDWTYHRPLGKLGLKEEAAGKVRVFAMVDPITQWMFAPLHKLLFAILRTLPMDGTFNQLKPVHRILKYEKVKGLYSLDLSAATDRLPVRLQAQFLDLLLKEIPNFGQKWAALLTSREYTIQSEKYSLATSVKYAVGQPMGALSSWAMLALIHHFIVQVAAWEVGHPRWKLFKDYAVLGDDLVIADHRVARRYLQLLKELGVECGLHKSILSRKGRGLEFAKTTFIDKQNVSPISLEELSVSISDLTSWAAFSSKYKLSWERQMRVLGFGFLARRKPFRKMSHALQLIYLSQIAKVDFNTEVLRLRRGAPKDFDTLYLDVFKSKVLFPLFQRSFKILTNYPKWLKRQLTMISGAGIQPDFQDFDRYDLRNSFDLLMGASHQAFPSKVRELIMSFIKELDSESQSALFYFSFNERTFNWLWPKLGINTFNEAVQLYFDMNSKLGRLSLNIYGVERGTPRLSPKKLPIQAKLFRDWSLVSHRIISTFRSQMETKGERS